MAHEQSMGMKKPMGKTFTPNYKSSKECVTYDAINRAFPSPVMFRSLQAKLYFEEKWRLQ